MDTRTKTVKYGVIALLSYLNAIAMQYVTLISGDTGKYNGTGIYSFKPESLLWFGACFFLLLKFVEGRVWKKKGMLILSVVLGLILGFATVWGQELLYNYSLFDSSERTFKAIAAALGIMIFTVPFVSFVTGLADSFVNKGAVEEKPGKLKPRAYFLIIWGILFLTFIPMFLYVYPLNFFGDAVDALVGDYLHNLRSTHHTPIHWLLMGWFYDFGVHFGSANLGMALFAIMQMLILSGSIAFLSYYLYKKQVRRSIRIVVLLASLINPVNAYFSVTAEKGTIGMALVLIGLVLLCMLFDDSFEGSKGLGIKGSVLIKMLLFALLVSVGSLFRNNMIYAVAVGGIVISLLAKGKKKKCAFLLMFVLTLGLYKAEFTGLVHSQNLVTDDENREALSVPIMCLTRIAVLHGDDMPEDFYEAISYFIPEDVQERYMVVSADSVKGYLDEWKLRKDKTVFFKLFIKGFFLYPGDYIDQVGNLTRSYWNPLYEHVLGSTTPAIRGGITDENYMNLEPKNLLPAGGEFYEWLYHSDGRFKLPLLSLFLRPALYTYVALFAFCYGIYRKDRRRTALCLIPLLYLGTIFLGPVLMFRYIYFNALCLGFSLYLIFYEEKRSE